MVSRGIILNQALGLKNRYLRLLQEQVNIILKNLIMLQRRQLSRVMGGFIMHGR